MFCTIDYYLTIYPMSFLGKIFRRGKNLPGKKWKRRDIIMFLERLEMYLSSGLEINKALQISEEGMKRRQQEVIKKIRVSVESGSTLCNGFRNHLGVSKTTSGLIEYGELSGSLSKSLMTARQLLEKEDELYKRCTGAMIYPLVIGIFAILLTIGLIRGVMSQIIPMLNSLRVELPLITKITIAISEIVTNYGLYILIGMVLVFIISRLIYKKSSKVRQLAHSFILITPIVGKLVYNYYLALFLHSSGALVDSGLSLKDAYLKTLPAISLVSLRLMLERQSEKVSRGVALGTILVHKRTPLFVTPLLNAGEASGTLGVSIIRAGVILDREIEHSLKKLTSLIEPVMMVGMGCIVGTIALSIMLPIYNISGALQK